MLPETIPANHPFLKGLSEAHLALLAANALPAHFDANEIVFREGEMANRFYLIIKGKILLESLRDNRETVLLQEMGDGDVLGWSWLFPPHYWRMDARAAEPTEAIFFYGTRLREEAESDHDFGYELMRRVAGSVIDRLQSARRVEPAAAHVHATT